MKPFFFILLILLISCADDSFNKVERLEGFRVLGIKASSPEVSPGGTSTLSLIVSDSNGGRVINGTHESCIDPGISVGAPVSCSHDPLTSQVGFSFDTSTLGAGTLYTGEIGSVSISVPANILTGRSSREQFNGVGHITIFRLNVDGQEVVAFKRIMATNRGSALNTNPSVSAILSNGASFTSAPNKGDILQSVTNSPETYPFRALDGSTETRTETYQIAWYLSSGELDKPKTRAGETTKYLSDAPSTPFVIVAVVRDERGGLDVRVQGVP